MPDQNDAINSRMITSRKALVNSLTLFLFWLPITFFSLLLVYTTLPYFTDPTNESFVIERMVLYDKDVWRWCFFIHITAGGFCILTALLQFSSWILKKRKRIHIIAGKIYVFVVLLIGAPTGFYMTFFAKGGLDERILFMVMAVFWFYSTYKGFVTAARDRNYLAHKFWMIRSYSMALTAVTFRVYHILFWAAGWSSFENYAISLWISVLGNAAVAEIIIYFTSRNYLKTITT